MSSFLKGFQSSNTSFFWRWEPDLKLNFKIEIENCFTSSAQSLSIYFSTMFLVCNVKGQCSVVDWFLCCTEQAINCLPSFTRWQCCFLGSFYLYYTTFDERWVDVREIRKIKKNLNCRQKFHEHFLLKKI